MKHGTVSGYRYHKCKCDECRAAVAAQAMRYRAAGGPRKAVPHGTVSGYNNYKCRCEECRAAVAAAARRYRASSSDYRRKQREVHARRRRAFLDEVQAIKLAVQCMDCDGTFEDPTKLDFDHRDPDSKLFNIGDGVSRRSRAAVYVEIGKCDVVCKPCHSKRGWARGQHGAEVAHA